MVKKNSNKLNYTTSIKKNSIYFCLDFSLYSLEAIYQTASIFLDRVYIFINNSSKEKVSITITGKNKLNSGEILKIAGEFSNELINSALRLKISLMNQKIREYIVGTALVSSLSNNGAPEDEQISAKMDWKDDPLGIAVRWEDKYKKKKKK